MTFKATVNECGQVTFPQEALDALGLKENSTFEFEVEGRTLILKRQPGLKPEHELKPERDRKAFDEWAAKWTGSMREQMLADGFNSTDEFMAAIRPL